MATYYVDKDTGNNGNPGSQAQPWETIEYAMELAGLIAGDIVRVVKAATDYSEDFQITSGSYDPPITLRPDDYADPPTIDKGEFAFNGCSGYTVSGFIFDSYTSQMIQVGISSRADDITVERCTFQHSTSASVRIGTTDGFVIDQCHFRDIRSRVANDDKNSIIFINSANVSNMTISNCTFEDIGSDGIHILAGADVSNLTVSDCVFGVNRPYSAVGTSWYNGDVTSWQDFSTNVGENAWDFKGGGILSNILVEDCLWFGFRTTVAGQDASGSTGEGAVIHDEAENVTVRNCVAYDSERGIQLSGTTGTSDDITLDGCFFHDNTTYGISARDLVRLTVTACKIVSNSNNLRMSNDVDFADVSNNMFVDGTYTRGTGMTGEGNWDFNLWKSQTKPVQWEGANDYTETTAVIDVNDTLAGIIRLRHQFADLPFTATQLQYHPGLADLYTAIGLCMMSGTTTTITQESVSPQRFSVLTEQ